MTYRARWFQAAYTGPWMNDRDDTVVPTVDEQPEGAPVVQDDVEAGEVSISELIRTAMEHSVEDHSEDVPLPRASDESDPVVVIDHAEETVVETSDETVDASVEESSDTATQLVSLVRQWVMAKRDLGAIGAIGTDGDELHVVPTWVEPAACDVAEVTADAVPAPSLKAVAEPVVLDAPESHLVPEPASVVAPLPVRQRGRPQSSPARRLGVLIDAQTTLPESVDGLFDSLSDQGTVSVSRAYGDWSSYGSQQWMPRLRHHGVQPSHHFALEHDQRSMVAMTIDAVDLARESAVDAMVIVGDLSSAHPLLQRLNACGIAVLGYGPSDTPYDVRSLCEEFVDLGFLESSHARGRHRA